MSVLFVCLFVYMFVCRFVNLFVLLLFVYFTEAETDSPTTSQSREVQGGRESRQPV